MEKDKVQKSGLLLFFYFSNVILLPELKRIVPPLSHGSRILEIYLGDFGRYVA